MRVCASVRVCVCVSGLRVQAGHPVAVEGAETRRALACQWMIDAHTPVPMDRVYSLVMKLAYTFAVNASARL